MEFHEKLQALRKQKGLTQEELAAALYVSRTAVSKWESGRGYPSIDSLKAIAAYFSVTVDELLSAGQALSIAEDDRRQTFARWRDLVFGLSDIGMTLLLFLPFFAAKSDGFIRGVSLLSLNNVRLYAWIAYLTVVILLVLWGILTLTLQSVSHPLWLKCKGNVSLALGGVAVVLFIIGLQPYAAIFALILSTVKAFWLFKRP